MADTGQTPRGAGCRRPELQHPVQVWQLNAAPTDRVNRKALVRHKAAASVQHWQSGLDDERLQGLYSRVRIKSALDARDLFRGAALVAQCARAAPRKLLQRRGPARKLLKTTILISIYVLLAVVDGISRGEC